MKLTRKKSIELCIELWTWLAETGNDKSDWPKWGKYGLIRVCCWFCEYDDRQKDRYCNRIDCYYCPLQKTYGDCAGTYYCQWYDAKTIRTKKKYAKLFLEQIKEIK